MCLQTNQGSFVWVSACGEFLLFFPHQQGFLLGFLSTEGILLASINCPRCIWCPMIIWDFIQGMFWPHCSWNMISVHRNVLQIHHDLDHYKTVTEKKTTLKEYTYLPSNSAIYYTQRQNKTAKRKGYEFFMSFYQRATDWHLISLGLLQYSNKSVITLPTIEHLMTIWRIILLTQLMKTSLQKTKNTEWSIN